MEIDRQLQKRYTAIRECRRTLSYKKDSLRRPLGKQFPTTAVRNARLIAIILGGACAELSNEPVEGASDYYR
jgi:hypothetical protein